MSNETVIFVCEHGSAKSVIAATYFNKFAEERGLEIRAVARGTNPDSELSPNTMTGLRADGLTPAETTPKKLSPSDFESAQYLVSFCELPKEIQNRTVEFWDDIPPVSENYEKAREAILQHIHRLPQFSNLQSP